MRGRMHSPAKTVSKMGKKESGKDERKNFESRGDKEDKTTADIPS